MTLKLPSPDLQISFSVMLSKFADTYLRTALMETVSKLDISEVDRQLGRFAGGEALAQLARHGIRGELVYATPVILQANPGLIGYYRLLYGYSQKQFYASATGFSAFKSMEMKGKLSHSAERHLSELCEALSPSARYLIEGIGDSRLTVRHLDDLALLTVGPQFRGSKNVEIGAKGIVQVFEAIVEIVRDEARDVNDRQILLTNAAGREVSIEFAPDPDIIICEKTSNNQQIPKIAIEVKAGTDYSNIHNRIGEAEKSHQKARRDGFVECWTVVNVQNLDRDLAHQESPSTNRFYSLASLVSKSDEEFADFRNRIVSLTGIIDSRR